MMNNQEAIIQYFGSLELKRAMKLIYKDSQLQAVVICEDRPGKVPILEVWRSTKQSPFSSKQIQIISGYKGFAGEITPVDFESVFNDITAKILSFMPT
ncbi:hypothetical protein DC914_RS26005 [Vibrio parahaemolyticus]|uniref:hypothetical protein n=1 Tax=Vibrio harveyi group TaxID=717610 RepID=UPI0006A6475B|nr:hypothetical protein [Vibrio diabolicus]EGR3229752.1 hypothetical protein [Vibrio parahaemolyticus]EGR5928106.1 hypothetical protein [Vibrio parahaemolyticus]EJG0181482.1 hypothetical protein [Vibrio parahaemolyticus]KOE92651.1 hypothetical protein ACS91_01945 [Vibrio parahaemolyticus]KOF28287.1 hypothetical protein ACX13_16765 [Vibrio parahaemolyticus]